MNEIIEDINIIGFAGTETRKRLLINNNMSPNSESEPNTKNCNYYIPLRCKDIRQQVEQIKLKK